MGLIFSPDLPILNQPMKRLIFSIAQTVLACVVFDANIQSAPASQAYGTVNNFDVVNDAGVPCHGFEIELDDIRSADITYTYDYNHYGTPKFTEQIFQDGLLKWHTNVLVDYSAVWTNTGWSAYTAVPATNIPPTMGHQFTNPNINFGGEHFGVGYFKNPSKVLYFWMIDGGSHTLTRGGQVYVSTPVFNYSPPVAAQPAAAVAVAVIPAPILPIKNEFSDAVWCKVITTTSQTNSAVDINDLMSPDPNNSGSRDWRNGETNVEVETEWQLLQIDYMSSDYSATNGLGGANAKLAGANRGLGHSDDVVTYRYEYYAYVGPYDDNSEPPTHEALCQMPGADGIHGSGAYASTVVVGKFLGAQMSAGAATPPLNLVDHVPDGQYGVAYPTRTVIIVSDTNFITSYTGALPAGMAFDTASATLYGTPYASGIFTITVTASSSNSSAVSKTYPFWIAASGQVLPPHSTVDVGVANTNAGSAVGTGIFTNGTKATVVATSAAGYKFVNWTANGTVVSTAASFTFTNVVNQSLVANFVINPNPPIQIASVGAGKFTLAWPTNYAGFTLQQISSLVSTNWNTTSETVSNVGGTFQAIVSQTNGPRYFRLKK